MSKSLVTNSQADLINISSTHLDKIFKPKSIAVIGASDNKGSVGYSLMKNMISSGFKGSIFPINIKRSLVQGIKCFKTISEISEEIDLAVIATPATTIPSLLEECGNNGIKGVVILSAGFKEIGEKGLVLYDQIKEIKLKHDISIIGPNCIGFLQPTLNINASFLSRNAIKGNIAFVSQSGALCASILDWAVDQSVGFSHFVSAGSMIDIDFADLIEYFGQDEDTDAILLYMESLVNPKRFLEISKSISSKKPIIVIKAGKSTEGAKAALSHTGSISGNDQVFNAAFKEAGIIRVDTIEQLFDCAQGLAMQPCPKGKRLSIVTNAGGPGVLATDYLISRGGQLATLEASTIENLNKFLPLHWSHNNPIDVLGDASADKFTHAVEESLKDPNTDACLAIFTTQGVSDPTLAAKKLSLLARENKKPLYACWMGEEDVKAGREILEAVKIPNYRYPESAVHVFLKMVDYNMNSSKNLRDIPTQSENLDVYLDKVTASAILTQAILEGRKQLTEVEAKDLLSLYHIPVPINEFVSSIPEAVKAASKIGFPVVLKLVSTNIGHKTEVGGIKLNLNSVEEVINAFSSITKNIYRNHPHVKIDGILVEKMYQSGQELLLGSIKDPIFGPVLVFGTGGTLVELWKDTNMALPPLNKEMALEVIKHTKAYSLLNGFRGRPKGDIRFLQKIIVQFSHLIIDHPEIKEIDINPFLISEIGGVALDAHIVLDVED